MNNYQNATLALVGSLAIVTLWHAGHVQNAWSVISTNQGVSGTTLKQEITPIGVDLLGVAVIVFIAGLSDDAGKMMIALGAGLWLLYLMSSHKSGGTGIFAGLNLQQAATNAANQYIQQKG